MSTHTEHAGWAWDRHIFSPVSVDTLEVNRWMRTFLVDTDKSSPPPKKMHMHEE